MNENNLAERIVELESRQAFQDHTIEQLNEVIIGQQQQVDRLESQVVRLAKKLDELGSEPGGLGIHDT